MTRRLLAVGVAVLLLGAYKIPNPNTPLHFAAQGGKVWVSGNGFSASGYSASLDRDNQRLRVFGFDGDPARVTWHPVKVETGRIFSGLEVAISLKDGSITVEKEEAEDIRLRPQKK